MRCNLRMESRVNHGETRWNYQLLMIIESIDFIFPITGYQAVQHAATASRTAMLKTAPTAEWLVYYAHKLAALPEHNLITYTC